MNTINNTGQFITGFVDRDLMFAALVMAAALVVLMGVIYPILDVQERARTRALAIGSRSPTTSMQDIRSAAELQKRRKIIAESLQDITNRNEKKKRVTNPYINKASCSGVFA